MQKNKHIIQILLTLAILIASSFGLSHSAHAQGFQYYPLATVPIGTTGSLTQAGQAVSPSTYIGNLYTFAFSIAIIIAVVSGVWAGVLYMVSESVTTKSSALNRIKNVGWGFALLLCSYLILNIINPQLVSWNLNLGNIDTSVQSGNLTTQQAQQLVLQTAANNAVAQSQTDAQNLTTAQTAVTTANTTLSSDATNLKTLQTQLAALKTQTPPATQQQIDVATQAITLAQQQVTTDTTAAVTAATTLSQTIQTAAVSAEKATAAQATAIVSSGFSAIQSDLNSSNASGGVGPAQADIQSLQSTYAAAVAKLNQEQTDASNANNTALVAQIQQDKAALASSASNQYGCLPAQLVVTAKTSGAVTMATGPTVTPVITCSSSSGN